jgi:prevent-host-death family protein
MFAVDSIHPVSDFSRKPAEYIRRLKETKKPEILTVNGRAEVVVQDAKAYEEMVELLETIKRVNTAAAAFDKGEGRKAQEAFAELDAKIKPKFGE